MTPQEEVEYYQETLEGGLREISQALGLDAEFYDRDQADGACYLDCFRDAATLLKRAGVAWDKEEWDWVVPATIAGKYAMVLSPFLALMEKELHANSGKGDRPGWLSMTPETGMLEIYYHVAKLQKAVKNNDIEGIKEYSADVANMAMMMADIFGTLTPSDNQEAV